MREDDAEQRLLERLRRRDEAAFAEFVREHEARVFRLVLRMIGDRAEAEDVAQEVFLTVFKSIDGFRGDAKIGTWLYRIATNHCRNRMKYHGRRARSRTEAYEDVGGAADAGAPPTVGRVDRPDDMAAGHEMERLVRRALEALDPEHRELIVLRDIEGLTYDEIHEVTGLREGTVKSRLHRARVALEAKVEVLSRGVPDAENGE